MLRLDTSRRQIHDPVTQAFKAAEFRRLTTNQNQRKRRRPTGDLPPALIAANQLSHSNSSAAGSLDRPHAL